jgi:drug/metabolite transporter (DMT)-like permease
LLLHLTVLVWGFTAILGRLISVSAPVLVSYRLLIVIVVMAALAKIKGQPFVQSPSAIARMLAAGAFVGLHWLLFYGCIKYAGIAVAVLCLSANTLFTALFEPVVFKSRVSKTQLLFGFLVMLGVSFLVRFETHADFTGLFMGIFSALFSAAFGSMNGRLAREVPAEVMTTIELSMALIVTGLSMVFGFADMVWPTQLSVSDIAWIFVLAIGCTVLPWLWSLRILQTLRPYALSLAVSLEPVYAMGIAWFLFPDAERLTWKFYLGTVILLLAVTANTLLKSKAEPDSASV